MVRLKAAKALEAALVSQFGESARKAVEEEVAHFLAQGTDPFQRSDLDAIESGVLKRVKEQRQVRSTSAPLVEGPSTRAVASTKEPQLASLTSSQSAPSLRTVPKPVLVKRPDCFDLWREYDYIQYANEEREKIRNKQAQSKRYLEALNEQQKQADARRDAEVLEKKKDRAAIMAEVQRTQRDAAVQHQKLLQKKQLQKEEADELLARVQREKDAKAGRLDEVKLVMAQERQAEEEYRQQEEARIKKKKDDESTLMREQFEVAVAFKQELRQKEKEEDTRLANEWKRLAARPLEAELPGGMIHKIRENQKRVDTLVGTMGVALVEKQRAQDAAEDARVEKDCRIFEKKQLEELSARKDATARRTREMFAGFKKQMEENTDKGENEKAADAWQAEMWRKNNEEFNAKETKKQMAQRDARKAMDAQNFANMVKIAGMKKSRPLAYLEQDLLFNRPLVEKMANSSFKTDHTVPLLEKAHALKAQQAARKAAEKG